MPPKPPLPPKAILFGAIGTLVETSRLQHDAFNAAFDEAGLDWIWDEVEYREMLRRPGGLARIERYAESMGQSVDVGALHRRKSEIFHEKLSDGISLRPGVADVIRAAQAAGLKLGFVTTTSQANITAIFDAVSPAVAQADFDFVGAGAMVGASKPAPDIYIYALDVLGVDAADAIAIEDTPAAAQSALSAGIATLAFPGRYAEGAFGGVFASTEQLTLDQFGLEPGPETA